jgi:hypothetical protein
MIYDDVLASEIDWRDLYRIPVSVALIPLLGAGFVLGFLLGALSDAFEEGVDAAMSFGE